MTGTAALVRLILRRDRVALLAWVLAFPLLHVAVAASFARLFATPAARALLGGSIGENPAVLALVGPLHDAGSVGGLTAWRLGGFVAALVALINGLTVIRHTRAEEDAGRRELLGATAIGRHAPLAAALLVVLAADLLLALLVAAGLVASGLPPVGAVALGASYAAAGAVFAAAGAVAAQVAGSARAARGLAGGLLALTYLARAAGDAARGGPGAWLSWLSPIGWAQKMRAFAGERWAPLALSAAVAVALVALAQLVSSRRDLGSGLLQPRPGPPVASPALAGAFGLAWRLHRAGIAAWILAFALAGAAFGAMARAVTQLVSGSVRLRLFVAALGGSGGLVDAYLAATAGILGVLASALAISSVLRLRAEEEAGRAEPILAAAVGRARWAASHVVLAVVAPAVALAAAGVTSGVVHGLAVGDVAAALPRAIAAAAVQLPGVWLCAGVALLLVGAAPRRAVAATWAIFAIFLVLGELGGLLGLGRSLTGLSPFAHVPRLPVAPLAVAPLVALAAVAAAMIALGIVALRRRDLS